MPLALGTRLGPYEILAPLGVGGMGEVYRARDTRLDRSVAVKVLPSNFTTDPERRARFEREAKAVSSLNHPHICTLHDVGHEQGTDYLVMELVEGETLAERLKKGALPLEQTLRTAIEIADALDKAHRQGVIHRDLKPGNVMLTKAGSKLMDFGLAKRALGGEGRGNVSVLPTESAPLTGQGTLLGTMAYMAPEQLEGKEADARADLWAFGCVLYEMATGRRAFEGKSQASLISAIMDKEPQPISQLQPLTPPALGRLVKVCLAKDPDERLQTAHDVMQELKWIAEAPSGSAAVPGGGLIPVASGRPRSGLVVVAFALLAGIVLGGLAGRWISVWRSSSAALPAAVFATIPFKTVQTDTAGQWASFTLSPNGQLVLLRQDQLLSVRPLSSFSADLLEGTEGGGFPAFSPDGSALAFVSGNRIKRVAASGGPVVDVAEATVGGGLAWGEDDWLYFSAGLGTGGIWRVPAVGGEAQAVTRVEDALGDNAHTFPQLLPGGKAVLFTALGPSGGSADARVVAQVRGSGERRTLVEHAMFGRFIPTGHLLHATNAGTVFAVPFDPVQLKTTGAAVPVLSDVGTGTWGGAAFLAVSDNGTLVFLRRSQRPGLAFRVVDSNGHEVGSPFPFDSTTMAKLGPGASLPALSPDGQRIAITARSPGTSDIWVLDSRSKEAERLTFDPAEDEFPVWSPDGRAVAYTSAQTGTTRRLFVKGVGSGAQPKLLRTWPRHLHVTSWSRDGRWLAAYDYTPTKALDIWVIPLDGKDPIAVATGKATESGAQFSPDGKWIAYVSNESGRPEVYVVSFPGLGARRQVSTGGGVAPQWDPQGRTLYYLQGGSLVAHEVSAGAEFGKGPSRRLFATQALNFQVTPGGRFILSEPNPQPPDSPLHLIVNWFPQLTAKFKK